MIHANRTLVCHLPPQASRKHCHRQCIIMHSMASTVLRVLIMALLACHHVVGFSWKLCGDGSAKVAKVNLAPDPPAPGNSVTFTVEGTAGM